MQTNQQIALAIAPTGLPTLPVLVVLLLNSRRFEMLNGRLDDQTRRHESAFCRRYGRAFVAPQRGRELPPVGQP